MSDNMKEITARSWFVVFNNPRDHGFTGSDNDILKQIAEIWCEDDGCSCAMTFCESAEGLEHVHAVLERDKVMRFSCVKKKFPAAHFEVTRGNKTQALDYIKKIGVFEEKGEIIRAEYQVGSILGNQGKRTDLYRIEEYINQGMSPNEIMDISILYRKYESLIKRAYYRKRIKDIGPVRNVIVYWNVGDSGTGKTHEYLDLVETFGLDKVYLVSDYEHPFDFYSGEDIIFLDELSTQVRFRTLLTWLDCYVCQIPARFSNGYALWSFVMIATKYPPEVLYNELVDNKAVSQFEELRRRINFVLYHYIENGQFKRHVVPMSEYVDYDTLKRQVHGPSYGFKELGKTEQMELPFK